jgi:hypothetical protein
MINKRLGAEIVEGKPYTTIGGEQVLPAVLRKEGQVLRKGG